MSSQFFHVSLYGRKQRPGAARHETAIGMLNEAARLPSATGHLASPLPPRHLYGKSPTQVGKDVVALGKASRDCRGRKLRSDAGLLMCVVASYPVPVHDGMAASEYNSWLTLTLNWLKDQFGQFLAGVVEHTDEAYRHVHAYVLPPQSAGGQLQWERVHLGRRAKQLAAAKGAGTRDQDEAYIAAMRSWQDSFYDEVSSRFGHARLTVKRERRSRQNHLHIRTLEAENASLAAKVRMLEEQLATTASHSSIPIQAGDAYLFDERDIHDHSRCDDTDDELSKMPRWPDAEDDHGYGDTMDEADDTTDHGWDEDAESVSTDHFDEFNISED